jgi:hypothetical protein
VNALPKRGPRTWNVELMELAILGRIPVETEQEMSMDLSLNGG